MAELRVLVCDDDHDMLELMLRRLDKMGFKPDRAADGGVASSLIRESLYDLIVTDIYMPEATGLELLELAKQRDPHVQVVIVTASATLDNAIDALNHGAFGYLSKPFDHLSVFDSTISRALEFRQLIMANQRMAEAQKMRGDMLEDEVAKRVGQLREKQQGLLDLLNCLPDGIVVVEEGGKLMMTSPAAEQWLARERRAGRQPIAEFIGQVHSEWAEDSGYAQLGDDKLRLLSIDYPHPNGKRRKAVIIRPAEDEPPAGPGTLAAENIAAIKAGLAWLFRQKLNVPMQQRVKDLANHISMLERLSGTNGQVGSGSGGPGLAPAVLPEYLRHEPALDSGAAWEEAETATPGGDAPVARSFEPDTRPAARAKRPVEEPPVDEPAAELPPEDDLVAAEGERAPLEASEIEPSEALEAEQVHLPQEYEEAEAEALDAEVSEPPPGPEAEHDVPEVPAELASAPTKVLHPEEAELLEQAQAEAEQEADPLQAEEPATSDPTDTGRIPLWQRVSQKRAAVPAKGTAARSQPPAEAEAEPGPEPDLAPGAELDSEADTDADALAARLGGLAGGQPEPEAPLKDQKPAKPPKGEPRSVEAGPATNPPKLEAAPKPRPQKAAARKPELAVAGPAPRGKGKDWPPELPSQDPDFDPELDVTG